MAQGSYKLRRQAGETAKEAGDYETAMSNYIWAAAFASDGQLEELLQLFEDCWASQASVGSGMPDEKGPAAEPEFHTL